MTLNKTHHGFWNEMGRIPRLQELLLTTMSYSQIADELGAEWNVKLSASALSGVIDRHQLNKGVHRALPPTKKTKAPDARGLASKVTTAYRRVTGKATVATLIEVGEPVQPSGLMEFDAKIPLDQRKQLHELVEAVPRNGVRGHCHWPVGDPRSKDFFYCGADTAARYCTFHANGARSDSKYQHAPRILFGS